MNGILTMTLTLALYQSGPPALPVPLTPDQQLILDLEFELKKEEVACDRIVTKMREVQKELAKSFDRSSMVQRRIIDRRAMLRTIPQPEQLVGHQVAERRVHTWLAEQKDWAMAYARIEKMQRDCNFFVELELPPDKKSEAESLSRALIELEFATLLLEHNEHDKGLAHAIKGRERARKDLPLAHLLIGRANEKLGQNEKAIEAYKLAAKWEGSASTSYNLATTSTKIGRRFERPAAALARLGP